MAVHHNSSITGNNSFICTDLVSEVGWLFYLEMNTKHYFMPNDFCPESWQFNNVQYTSCPEKSY